MCSRTSRCHVALRRCGQRRCVRPSSIPGNFSGTAEDARRSDAVSAHADFAASVEKHDPHAILPLSEPTKDQPALAVRRSPASTAQARVRVPSVPPRGSKTPSGTGFIWDGHAVTNDHVVQGAGAVAVRLASGEVVQANARATGGMPVVRYLNNGSPEGIRSPCRGYRK
jgi:S1-C subfamily serine protease